MKLIIGIAAILLPLFSLSRQPVKPLTTGDAVPALPIGNAINYSKTHTMLNGFKDKLVILDFMNTYCSNCIKALPAFDSLRRRYKDKLEIFMVTSEPKERAVTFMKNNPIAREVSIPFIVNDTLLEKLFPHVFVSHEAWIYNGVVVAITGADYVTAENINTVLSGVVPRWEVKNDIGEYDYEASLLAINTATTKYATGNNIYTTVCTPHLKGVGLRYTDNVDSITGVRTIRAINYPIAALYLQSLTERDSFTRSHVLLEPASAGLLTYPDTGYRNIWDEKNTYCYEATFPRGPSDALVKRKIQADLDAYLQVSSAFETIPTTCYVLLQDSGIIPPPASEDYASLANRASKDEMVFMSADQLVSLLNNSFWGTPFYNGISDRVPLPVMLLEKVLTGMDILKKELQKQHLLLREVTREAYMLLLAKQSTLPHQN